DLSMSARVVAALFGAAAGLFAQSFTGQISGLVTDPSGAVIAGAQIVITDVERNTTFKAVSNETGLYLVTQLPPGTYSVTAEHAGFRKWVLDQMPLTTQQRATLNIVMEVGSVIEQVQVTGE